MKKLVVLGGGYGGLTVIHHLLSMEIPDDTVIVLVDRMPFQGLKTEYYALAAGTVAESDIRIPFPNDPRLVLKYGEVTSIRLNEKKIYLDDGEELGYDWLIIGLGCTDRYHGIPGAKEHTLSLQTLSSTRKTYQRINDIKPYGQITIVGGGLSGVEVAAELRESRGDLNIRILDRGPKILSAFPAKLQDFVQTWFEQHHVEIVSHANVTRVEKGAVYDNGKVFYSDEILWTAGIEPVPVVRQLALPKDQIGRIKLNEYHQVPQYPEVFVVGDCASLPFPPSGQAAEAQGKQIAEVIYGMWKGHLPHLGKIKLKGILGSLGKRTGFGVMGSKTIITGRVPRLLKSGVLWMSKHHLG